MSGLDAPGPLAERLEACWAGIAAPENRPFLRLFFEVFGVAAHQPGRFDEFLPRVGQRLDQRARRAVAGPQFDLPGDRPAILLPRRFPPGHRRDRTRRTAGTRPNG
jgi:hypothetical protein